MAKLVLNLPDEHLDEIIDTYAAAHDWTPEHGDKVAFCGEMVAEGIMQVLRAKRGESAAIAAKQAAIDEVNQYVVITIG